MMTQAKCSGVLANRYIVGAKMASELCSSPHPIDGRARTRQSGATTKALLPGPFP